MSEAGKKDLRKIARVLKADGTEGGLILSLYDDSLSENIDLKEPVFVFYDELPVPFYIESKEPKGEAKIKVKLTDIRDMKDAEEIRGRDVFILKKKDGSRNESGFAGNEIPDPEKITGWIVTDPSGKKIGRLTGFEDIPGNPCIYMETGKGQKMIPFNEDLITGINEKSGIISMKIPEGLL
jgi:16S rRNA processing protein RimM